MKRVLASVCATIMLTSVFAGCAPSKKVSNKEIVLAGIYRQADSPWSYYESHASADVSKGLGAKDFLFYDAKMNPDTYLKAIDDAISKHVSGILVDISDQKLSTITVNKCNAANIPIIACDTPLVDETGKSLAPFVGYDAQKAGGQVSDWVIDYVKTNKFITNDTGVIFLMTNETADCITRSIGAQKVWNEEMASFAKNKVFKADYNGETDKAENAVTTLATANTNIKKWIVIAPNDKGAYGAARALEKAKLDKTSIVTGFDGTYAKVEFSKAYSCYIASGYVSNIDVGTAAATSMMNYIKNGKAIPADTKVSTIVITKQNYVEMMKGKVN